MASSTLLCPTPPVPSRASSRSLNQLQLNPFGLSLPFNFRSSEGANLAIRNAPQPFKVLCKRRAKGRARLEVPDKPDPVYRNRLVNLFVNRILKNGKKSLAYMIVYRALKRIQEKTGSNPLTVLRDAVQETTPDVSVKARRVGGSNLQIPVEVGATKGRAFAIGWILTAARKRHGRSMIMKLSNEILEAANGAGEAVRKKEEVHKIAEANRAFAHFR